MTNFKNVARSLGLNGCKAVLAGGFNAAYVAHHSVCSDSTARALRAACLTVVVASMAKAKAAATVVATTPAAAVPLVNAEALVERLIAHLGCCVRQSDTVPGCRKALGYVAPAAKGCAVVARFEAAEGVVSAFRRMGYENDGGVATKRLINSLARVCVRTGKEAAEVVQDWIIKNDTSKASSLLASLYDAAVRERAHQEYCSALEVDIDAEALPELGNTTTQEEAKANQKAARKAAKWAAKAAVVAVKKGKAVAPVAVAVEVAAEPAVKAEAVPSIMVVGFTVQDAMFCLGIDHKAVAANMSKTEAGVVATGVSLDIGYMQVAA